MASSSASESEEEGYACNKCSQAIPDGAARFHCNECEDFDVCGDCYFAVEGRNVHQHKLTKIAEQEVPSILWRFKDPKSSNQVVLGNWPTAVPKRSSAIKDHRIKAVLSLMEDTEVKERAPELHEIYQGRPCVIHEGVAYNLITLPDAINPTMVFEDRPDLVGLLERTTLWIDHALKAGNVLVHCQKGQKRSPTILLAWLITRGYTASDAINMISRNYANYRDYVADEAGRSWGDRYRRERSLWLQKLQEWARHWKTEQPAWAKRHVKLLQSWEALHAAAAETASKPRGGEPEAKKRKSEAVEQK